MYRALSGACSSRNRSAFIRPHYTLTILRRKPDAVWVIAKGSDVAYDEQLADRVRAALGEQPNLTERKMFGGLAFLLGGHMCCGIVGEDLMVRVGHDAYEQAISKPHARPMDFTGRPSKGMVYVAPAGLRTAKSLREWIERGAKFAAPLPAKKPTPRRSPKPKR